MFMISPAKSPAAAPVRISKTEDSQLISYLLLLRYGTDLSPNPRKPLLNITTVSRLSKVKYSTVRELISLGLKSL